MARARAHTRVVRGKSDRLMVWILVAATDAAVGASSSVLLATLNAAALALRPFTLVRTRLLVSWLSDQTAATEEPTGAIGEIVVSQAAAAAGVGSIPTPVTEGDGDFWVWQALQDHFIFGTAVGFRAQQARQYIIDSKSMRKVGVDEDMALVVENDHVAHGAIVGVKGRILIKLH